MRAIDPTAQALREARGGLAERMLIWIEARHRLTGETEALGLWTGEDSETITVTDMWTGAPATRVFHGAGSTLGIAGVQHEAGLSVRPVRLSLSALSAPVIDAVRLYDPRGARVQIWRRTLSPDTGLAVGVPEPWFKGFCNKAPIPRPEPGGEAVLAMELVSTTRLVAIPNGRRKSDAAQRTRDPDDRFRRYKAIARTIDVPWGEKDGRVIGGR
ncbi:MAG: hypothetical protein U1E59_02170 [Amaricoccus sp.]